RALVLLSGACRGAVGSSGVSAEGLLELVQPDSPPAQSLQLLAPSSRAHRAGQSDRIEPDHAGDVAPGVLVLAVQGVLAAGTGLAGVALLDFVAVPLGQDQHPGGRQLPLVLAAGANVRLEPVVRQARDALPSMRLVTADAELAEGRRTVRVGRA